MEQFENWLIENGMSSVSAYKYSRAINTISEDMISEGVIHINLYTFNFSSDFHETISKIRNNSNFIIKNKTGHQMYSSALTHFERYIKSFTEQDDYKYEDIALTQEDESFVEGRSVLVKHVTRERNPQLIQKAKDNFKKKHGSLYCQVCEFDFAQKYGRIGEDFIEAHHIKPVSEMKDGEKTKIEDIIMVCSNCHSMIHRKRPWLNKEEIKSILK